MCDQSIWILPLDLDFVLNLNVKMAKTYFIFFFAETFSWHKHWESDSVNSNHAGFARETDENKSTNIKTQNHPWLMLQQQ